LNACLSVKNVKIIRKFQNREGAKKNLRTVETIRKPSLQHDKNITHLLSFLSH
jgi:hypothetical protein